MTLSFGNMIKMLVSSPLFDIELQKHFSSLFQMTITSQKKIFKSPFLNHMVTCWIVPHTSVFPNMMPPSIPCPLPYLYKRFQKSTKLVTLKMATAVFARKLEDPQHSLWCNSKSQINAIGCRPSMTEAHSFTDSTSCECFSSEFRFLCKPSIRY